MASGASLGLPSNSPCAQGDLQGTRSPHEAVAQCRFPSSLSVCDGNAEMRKPIQARGKEYEPFEWRIPTTEGLTLSVGDRNRSELPAGQPVGRSTRYRPVARQCLIEVT